MDISYGYLGYFIALFIWMPGGFQWIFQMDTWDISLRFLYGCLGHFNGYLGYFNGHFIWMPSAFNGYFI
jgi:hypothetical protein